MPDIAEPDLREVQQDYDEEIVHAVVPVRHDGPMTVHELPARNAISRPLTTSLTDVIEVAPFDLKRKYLIVTCTQAVYLGHNKQLTNNGDVGQLPAGVMLALPSAAPVFCKAVTTPGVLSYWLGSWAE